MAITYPLSTPTTIGLESIKIRAVNAVTTSESPFTYKQQIIEHDGQRWEATIQIPTSLRNLAAEWTAFLTALKGPVGTFLLGDPDYSSPRGTVSACTLSGTEGSESATVVMAGSLLAGDYIQLGSGSSAKLHKVLQDQSGNGTLEIWPKLRDTYSAETVILTNPKGVFKLAQSSANWAVDVNSQYTISFECVEALT